MAQHTIESRVRRRGTTVTVRRITAVYDPVAGAVTETPVDYPTRCIVDYDAETLADGALERGERRLYFAASQLSIVLSPLTAVDPADPSLGTRRDTVIIGGVHHEVVIVQPEYDRDAVIAFTVSVRR